MTDEPLKVWRDRDGALLRLRLARPKANIVDAAMIAALDAALAENLADPRLKAVLIDHEGRTSASAPACRSICRASSRRC